MTKNNIHKNALRSGSYSLVITLVVLAILIVVNILASVLPSTWTQWDMSSTQLYSVGSNTTALVQNLQKDVQIYWLVQSDAEWDVLENLLEKYESLSSRVDVIKKNPDVYPTFTQQYTDETVQNNSLIVTCGTKSRYIPLDDIYVTEINWTTYSYEYSFNGEGAITSAIDYVTSDDLPLVYILEGHGEAELPSFLTEQLESENIDTVKMSLLTLEAVPEDADCVLIYAPQSDISEDEKNKLASFVAGGGKLMVLAGPLEEELTNLNSLLGDYGVTVNEGIVVEGSSDHYFYGYPYILLPEIESHTITNPLIEEEYYALVPLAHGLMVGSDNGTGTVTELLTTSSEAFSKLAGFGLDTYSKEDGDIDGPFALAVSIADDSGGQMVWLASSEMLEEIYVSYSSGANLDLVMNALSDMIDKTETITIRSKSLGYTYLTISESASSTLKVLMIGVVPLGYLTVGMYVILKKRRLQNETV